MFTGSLSILNEDKAIEREELGLSRCSPAPFARVPTPPQLWVGLETLRGIRMVDQCEFPGAAPQVMEGLWAWYKQKTAGWKHAVLAKILCKRPMVAIGTLQAVSVSRENERW